MNLSDIINNKLKLKQEVVQLPESTKFYAIGKNSETIKLFNISKIDAIIDDYATIDNWNGIPLISSTELSIDSFIINCSTSISPIDVKNSFIKKGFNKIIDYYQFVNSTKNKFIYLPDFSIDTYNDFNTNLVKWNELYDNLKDSKSKKILEDIVSFRLTCNPNYMKDYHVELKEQYMEDFMEYKNEVMVDVGGFDGDTSQIFAERYTDYKCIHLFEPSEINLKNAKIRLKDNRNIKYYQLGLSNENKIVEFDSLSGSSSRISEKGDSKIYLKKLDDVITEKITFIKMDIEGSELVALKGSINHIKVNHPKLAISVYHNAEDFWKVPELVLSYRDDYDIYLRHYTQGWSETIMYFKPK